MSDNDGIEVRHDGEVTRITLDDPGTRNALSADRMMALAAHLRANDASGATSVVVVTAEGPAFSAGHDIRELCGAERETVEEVFAACVDLMAAIRDVDQPVIAAVDGVATAAGCQLVSACDLALATERSTFATPGVRIGLFCSTPMVPLSRAVGRKRAMQMLLTGESIDAATAADWGLINAAVPDGGLDGAVDALVGDIVRWSPHTIAVGKGAFYDQLDRSEPDAYELTRRVMVTNAVDPVAREGMSAFLDKREPEWPR